MVERIYVEKHIGVKKLPTSFDCIDCW